MATQPRSTLVAAFVAAAFLASTALAAPSDPPAAKKAGQAAGHVPQEGPAPGKKTEPAKANDGHAATPVKKAETAAHVEPAPGASPVATAAPVKKKARVDRKALEADVRQVVTRINAAMQEVASAPAAKPAAKAASTGHGSTGGRGAPVVPARAPGKTRPSPLLVWDDTLKRGNVTLVWEPDLVPASSWTKLVWGEDKK